MIKRVYNLSISQSHDPYAEAGRATLRYIKYFLLFLTVWQDSSVPGSIFQIMEYFPNIYPVRPFEVFLVLNAIILLIERTISQDYTLRRSYFWGPLLLIWFALFLSWARGCFIRQEISIVYEVHEAFLTPIEFFIFLNLFRDKQEWRTILLMIILGTVAKAADGVWIFYFSTAEVKGWGVLQMWRDGCLLGIGITALVLLRHYKGQTFLWLKRLMLYASPLLFFSLIVSYRRTYFVAIIICLILMFFTLPKDKRVHHIKIFFAITLAIFVFIFLTNPIGFIARMFAVVDPSGEGSAYIRLMEFPNVIRNIYENPIFGTAIGTRWHQYYHMPLFANFTGFGTHNSYLYWPLRGGIFLTVGFWWMIVRMWKVVLLQVRFANTEDERFLTQVSLYMLIIYHVSSFFGLIYGDATTVLLALHLVVLQLYIEDIHSVANLKNVKIRKTLREKTHVYLQ
jgi:hypothetical protein